MGKINSVPARIDPKLDAQIKEIAKKNSVNFRQASEDIAKLIDEAKRENKKLISTRSIEF